MQKTISFWSAVLFFAPYRAQSPRCREDAFSGHLSCVDGLRITVLHLGVPGFYSICAWVLGVYVYVWCMQVWDLQVRQCLGFGASRAKRRKQRTIIMRKVVKEECAAAVCECCVVLSVPGKYVWLAVHLCKR